jgi:polysaccharide export outer membrane protein
MNKTVSLGVGFSLFLLSAAAASAQADRQQPLPPHGSYVIGPGDVLDIIAWRNRELTLQVTVRPDGWISFPLVGELLVAGSTAIEVQKKLETSLIEIVTSPTVTVVVTRTAPLKISILGKVRQPGRYSLEAPATVLDVLAVAGGPTEYANPDLMYVLRPTGSTDAPYQKIPVAYSLTVDPGRAKANVPVGAGDIIIVP